VGTLVVLPNAPANVNILLQKFRRVGRANRSLPRLEGGFSRDNSASA
jgi:hypothetical protein